MENNNNQNNSNGQIRIAQAGQVNDVIPVKKQTDTLLSPTTNDNGNVIEIKQANPVNSSLYEEEGEVDNTPPPQLPKQNAQTDFIPVAPTQPVVEEQPMVAPTQPEQKVEPIVQPEPKVEIPQPARVTPVVETKPVAPATPSKPTSSFSNINLKSEEGTNSFNIKIIGIGGAGCNVINHIAASHKAIKDMTTIYAFNTDLCSLKLMKNVENLFLLNKEELKGYGSGGNPEIGKKAVEKDAETIKKELTGTDILFIIAGMGKGAGSGGAPELAKIAKDLGILTVSIVNMPSVACEGNIIYNNAFNSLQSLIQYSDSVSTISNEKIISNNKDISFYDAYELANEEIADIIEDIINIIFKASVMNIDFADLKSFFKENKFFMANRLEIESTGLNQTQLRDKLNDKIKKSFSDVNINNCKQVVANISLAKDAPTTILADINKSFADITRNDKLTLVAGVNYNDQKKIIISFLISGKNYSSDFKNAFDADRTAENNWDDQIVKVQAVNDSDANKYDNLMKDVDEAAKTTEDILKQNNGNDDIG